jgi:lysozyme family protein
MSLEQIIDGVLSRESDKYTNDPLDAGGPTKYGITLRTLSRFRRFPATAADVQALTRDEAVTIYRWLYVEEPGFDKLHTVNREVAEKLVDQGVLCSPRRASEWLQRALNAFNRMQRDYPDIKVDGDVGPATQRALVSFLHVRGREGVPVLIEALKALQGAYLIDLAERRPTDEAFTFGWFKHRVAFTPGATP